MFVDKMTMICDLEIIYNKKGNCLNLPRQLTSSQSWSMGAVAEQVHWGSGQTIMSALLASAAAALTVVTPSASLEGSRMRREIRSRLAHALRINKYQCHWSQWAHSLFLHPGPVCLFPSTWYPGRCQQFTSNRRVEIKDRKQKH